MGKRGRSARGDLIALLVLDLMCIAEFCWVRSWGPAAHPRCGRGCPEFLMVLYCGDTLRCILRFRELTGHWPDLRKRDLGAKDKEKEEKEL